MSRPKEYKHSEETKRRISKSLKGFKHSKKTKEKWKQMRRGKGNSMYGKHHSTQSKGKISKNAKRRFKNPKNHPNWKNGRKIGRQGYILIHNPSHPFCDSQRYVREHRLVMEKYLKRYLKLTEVVHHINGITYDNRIENLILFHNENAHKTFHKKLRCKS